MLHLPNIRKLRIKSVNILYSVMIGMSFTKDLANMILQELIFLNFMENIWISTKWLVRRKANFVNTSFISNLQTVV